MTALDTSPRTTHRPRPLTGLAKAEFLQFLRNKTLIYTGMVTPVALPLIMFFVIRRGTDPDAPATAARLAIDMFLCMAVLFVQYYSVLSMVTTRRSEGVLRRLRTGEAPDWKIQAAPAVPGIALAVIGAVVVGVVVFVAGAPTPVNPVAILLALAWGLVLFALLALATSGFTRNAEAAQITSLPIIALTVAGLGSIRSVVPDRVAAVLDLTPYAAISDLVAIGTTGRPEVPAAGEAGLAPVDFAGSFAEFGRPVVTLVAWTIVAAVLTRRYFRWDDRG
ncbi:ABC transporter permease [Nakamurella sp. YIM 132087]|uniref:ABC transporter permease n=1 Tax=Nakamurella alba TaxID=2665158 RepID=A0A7K1FR05_9ACTN|nr:ABC transporter permease [Nakamurella alba]MTD16500.1 ABC transporter permease [Nakamurella alba]